MERNKYLELCKSCAMLSREVNGTKQTIPSQLIVTCDGLPYYPIGYYLDYDSTGTPRHTAYLHDLDANSITKCKLNDVEGLIDKR